MRLFCWIEDLRVDLTKSDVGERIDEDEDEIGGEALEYDDVIVADDDIGEVDFDE